MRKERIISLAGDEKYGLYHSVNSGAPEKIELMTVHGRPMYVVSYKESNTVTLVNPDHVIEIGVENFNRS